MFWSRRSSSPAPPHIHPMMRRQVSHFLRLKLSNIKRLKGRRRFSAAVNFQEKSKHEKTVGEKPESAALLNLDLSDCSSPPGEHFVFFRHTRETVTPPIEEDLCHVVHVDSAAMLLSLS